jgi:hypothetical protein
VYFTDFDAPVSTPRRIASLAAGPGMNLVAAAYGFGLAWSGASSWMAAFGIANTALFVANILPATQVEGAIRHQSDGMQILRLLFKPAMRSSYQEGASMTEDGQAVLVHAVEDAQIVGAQEVTENHLLRALNQDTNLGPLFAGVGLDRRLPPLEYPEESHLDAPVWTAGAMGVVEATFRKARDMGHAKPNAACVCLALMESTTPAGQIVREAGIADGVQALAMRGLRQEPEGGGSLVSPDLPLERWGAAADRVLDMAHRIAAADSSTLVGTHHIVAAVVRDASSRGAQALTSLGFLLQRRDGPLRLEPLDRPPLLSPQAAMAVAAALWRTGAAYPTGTGELCVGIIDQGEGIGAKIFNDAGITLESMVRALRQSPRENNEPAGCTPASRRMWELRASARMGAGRWLESRADFLIALGAATTDEQGAMCRNNTAWVSLMSGDVSLRAEALEMARAALQFKPDQRAFIGTYGFALLENGSTAEAAAVLEPVAGTQPRPRDQALDLCLLAMCSARLGRRDEAMKHMEAARGADPRCALLARAQAEIERVAATAAVS